jgi:hypothetical protein
MGTHAITHDNKTSPLQTLLNATTEILTCRVLKPRNIEVKTLRIGHLLDTSQSVKYYRLLTCVEIEKRVRSEGPMDVET